MLTIINILAASTLASCLCEHCDPLLYAPKVAMLRPVYYQQWELSYPQAGREADWQQVWPSLGFSRTYDELNPGLPDGLRTVMYNDDEDILDIRNIGTHGGRIYIMDSESSLLVYNNDTEYDVISDQDDAQEANVSTRQMMRSTFLGSPYAPDATELTTEPDVMYTCYIPSIRWTSQTDTLVIEAPMVPVVYTYAVRYGFSHGIDYVAIARGALCGMACGSCLWDRDPLDHRVSVGYDAEVDSAAVEAYVRSFGHPARNESATYGLILEVRLKNGKILNYDFDISDQMRWQPRGGVILVDGIEIPDSVGQQPTGGGFDVTVTGWGEFEDIPIDL